MSIDEFVDHLDLILLYRVEDLLFLLVVFYFGIVVLLLLACGLRFDPEKVAGFLIHLDGVLHRDHVWVFALALQLRD